MNVRFILENITYKKNQHKVSAGFTLVELLLVVGIIATLAIVVFVALDPAKRFADSRNARRTTDVETILSAVHQYVIDNKGEFPPSVDETEKQIGTGVSGCELFGGLCSANLSYCLDLGSMLPRYLKAIPFDPKDGTAEKTQYTIVRDSYGIVTVKACNAEGSIISISK